MKIFAISDKAKDLRPVVQDLNMKRGLREIEEANKPTSQHDEEETDEVGDLDTVFDEEYNKPEPKQSKWAKYTPEAPVQDDDDEEDTSITTDWTDTSLRKANSNKRKYSKVKKQADEEIEEDNEETVENLKKRRVDTARSSHDAVVPNLQSTKRSSAPSQKPQTKPIGSSKWSKYATTTTVDDDGEEEDSFSFL